MSKKIYEIDGTRFSTLEEFFDEIERVLIPGVSWGRNLDAFNDILRGGFGTPDEGYVLVWLNSAVSREQLSYAETLRHRRKMLQSCHPSNRDKVRNAISMAEMRQGQTLFDLLVEILQDHGPGSENEASGIELVFR